MPAATWRAAVLIGACLLLALPTGTIAGAGGAEAHGRVSAPTPPPGSPERRAILSVLRAEIRRTHGLEVVFLVEHLKVKDGWSWVHTRPRSKDGLSNYEDISALLRDDGRGWRVLDLSDGEIEGVRKRFPKAPKDIFPVQ